MCNAGGVSLCCDADLNVSNTVVNLPPSCSSTLCAFYKPIYVLLFCIINPINHRLRSLQSHESFLVFPLAVKKTVPLSIKMHVHISCVALFATNLIIFTTSTLLVDYTAPSPASALGSPQLEGSYLGDHLDPSAPAGSPAYIQPGTDANGKPALHYHREPEDRRAEVKAKGTYAAGKQYFVGYEFRLSNVHEHLALFQWYDILLPSSWARND